jgi:hypothetical protein
MEKWAGRSSIAVADPDLLQSTVFLAQGGLVFTDIDAG